MGDEVTVIITTGTHDEAAVGAALWQFATSREVVVELGGPIYSTADTHWLIARDDGKVVGFVSWRRMPTAIYYDHAYVIPGRRSRGVFTQLASERDKATAELGLPLKAVIRAKRLAGYKRRGWSASSKRRGLWVHITKDAK